MKNFNWLQNLIEISCENNYSYSILNKSNDEKNDKCEQNNVNGQIKLIYTFLFVNPYEILFDNNSKNTDVELYLDTRFTDNEVETMTREIEIYYPKYEKYKDISVYVSLCEFVELFYDKDIEKFKRYKEFQIERFPQSNDIFFKHYRMMFMILCSNLENTTFKNNKFYRKFLRYFKNIYQNFKKSDELFDYQILYKFIIYNLNNNFLIIKKFKSFLKENEFEKGYENEIEKGYEKEIENGCKKEFEEGFLRFLYDLKDQEFKNGLKVNELIYEFLERFKGFMCDVFKIKNLRKYKLETVSENEFQIFIKKN
ncbi:hypothetical protein HERIO_466 [Hepatospora eriocheir]|uniref:Uncharacterized protein n=1 Tax=Hepatospora eriocheir TaxID=1081669 RepID=A0A1X0QD06_9MICR|nr:hypothetical protein HERIO_466 [Hepatospora eriocheir]